MKRQRQQRSDVITRFAPGGMYYAMVAATGACVVSLLACIFGDAPSEESLEFIYYLVIMSVAGIVFLPSAWRVFSITDEGLEVQGGQRTRLYPWSELGGVRSREYTDHDGGGSAVTSVLYSRSGRKLCRIGPWIRHRKQLVREIARHVRANKQSTIA